MLLLTNNKVIIVEKAWLLYETLIRMDDPLWKNYSVGPRYLKTQNGFIQSVQATRIEYELPHNIQEIAGPWNSLEMLLIQINLNLGVTLYNNDAFTEMSCPLNNSLELPGFWVTTYLKRWLFFLWVYYTCGIRSVFELVLLLYLCREIQDGLWRWNGGH